MRKVHQNFPVQKFINFKNSHFDALNIMKYVPNMLDISNNLG